MLIVCHKHLAWIWHFRPDMYQHPQDSSSAFLLDVAALRGTHVSALANMEGGIHVLRVGKVGGNS